MHADTLDTVETKEQGKIVISNARRYTLLALVRPASWLFRVCADGSRVVLFDAVCGCL